MAVQQFIYKTTILICLGKRIIIVKGAGSVKNQTACWKLGSYWCLWYHQRHFPSFFNDSILTLFVFSHCADCFLGKKEVSRCLSFADQHKAAVLPEFRSCLCTLCVAARESGHRYPDGWMWCSVCLCLLELKASFNVCSCSKEILFTKPHFWPMLDLTVSL